MSTNTKKIDLSKCQIGQRVKLRNGEITEIYRIDENEGVQWPFHILNHGWYTRLGISILPDEFEKVIEILPLPKKPAKKPLQPAKLMSKKDVRAAIKHAEATLKLLKGLIKP